MEMDVYLRFLLALVFVLALIAAVGWAARRYGMGGRLGMAGSGRRLAIVETTALDAKRRLALIRRDGVEHLILMGGPGDVVIETGITPPADTSTQPQPAPSRPRPDLPEERGTRLPKFVQTLKLAERMGQARRVALGQRRAP
jgi:flagellar protein FliO/FliZ